MHKDTHKSIKLFRRTSLPSQAQGKPRSQLRMSDLSPGQRAQAANYDNAVIIDGSEMTIIAPTGNVASSIESALAQRRSEGL